MEGSTCECGRKRRKLRRRRRERKSVLSFYNRQHENAHKCKSHNAPSDNEMPARVHKQGGVRTGRMKRANDRPNGH